MKPLIALLLAALVSAGSAARAEDKANAGYVVFGPIADCAGKPVVDTTVEAVAASTAAFKGKCVRLRGIWGGSRIFSDLDAYRATPQMRGDERSRATAGRFIGVYEPDVFSRNTRTPAEVEVVGVVGTCADLWDGSMMVVGYCHQESANWIGIARARSRPLHPLRPVSDADRLKVGRLAAAPADMAERAGAVAVTRRWLAAVQGGDRLALAGLYGQEKPEPDPEWDPVAQIFRTPAGLYRDRRLFRPDPQIEIFARKQPGAAGPDLSEEGWQWELVSCVCKLGDCSGRWPISLEDAWNRRDRPYVCLQLSQMNDPNEPLVYQVAAPIDYRTLREPPPR